MTDNTSTLIGPLALGREDYYRFLAKGYGMATATGRDAILDHVRTHAADRLPERELDAVSGARAAPEPGSYAS